MTLLRRLGVFLGIVVVAVVLARWVVHGPVNDQTLSNSVTREAGYLPFLTPGYCARDDGPLTCSVILDAPDCADPGSCPSGTTYLVQVSKGSSCWTARATGRSADKRMPSRIDGCVRLWS